MASVPGERRSYLGLLCDELEILSLLRSSVDVKLLCLQRFVRLFAYGSSTLVLVLYLQALGITKTRIGSFMALTLAGDVCISLVLTLVADRIGRKTILALGAVLMSGSGVVFAVSENYWFLLAAAVFGVISPRWIDYATPINRQIRLSLIGAKWEGDRTIQSYRGELRGASDVSDNSARYIRLV